MSSGDKGNFDNLYMLFWFQMTNVLDFHRSFEKCSRLKEAH